MKNKYKIAIYIRLSLEDSKTESLSIHNQRLALRKHAESLVNDDYEVLEFVDNGYSGTNFERPAVQELLELVKINEIDCIIVKDFSRFGRNSIETGYFIERVFPLFKIRFISLNDDFDTINYNGDTGGMEFAFKYLINEYYSLDLSRKSKSAKYMKMKNGEYQSKICCYGYKKSANNRLEIDDEAASVVKMIFDMALDGKSNIGITQALYEKGIKTPGEYRANAGKHYYDISRSQGMWHSSAISRILTDERFIGTYVIGKRSVKEVGGTRSRLKDESEWFKIPDHHPAIISKEDFESVKSIRRTFPCNKQKKTVYPLRSKVFCGCCLHTMSRLLKLKPVFYCRHTQIDESSPCNGLRIEEQELHNLIYEIISKQAGVLLNVENINHAESYEAHLEEKLNYEKMILDCTENKKLLYEKLLLSEISLDEYKGLKTEYDLRLNDLKRIYSDASLKAEIIQKENEDKAHLNKIANEVSKENSLNQVLSDLLVDKVLIYPNDSVEIVWKAKDFAKNI